MKFTLAMERRLEAAGYVGRDARERCGRCGKHERDANNGDVCRRHQANVSVMGWCPSFKAKEPK